MFRDHGQAAALNVSGSMKMSLICPFFDAGFDMSWQQFDLSVWQMFNQDGKRHVGVFKTLRTIFVLWKLDIHIDSLCLQSKEHSMHVFCLILCRNKGCDQLTMTKTSFPNTDPTWFTCCWSERLETRINAWRWNAPNKCVGTDTLHWVNLWSFASTVCDLRSHKRWWEGQFKKNVEQKILDWIATIWGMDLDASNLAYCLLRTKEFRGNSRFPRAPGCGSDINYLSTTVVVEVLSCTCYCT